MFAVAKKFIWISFELMKKIDSIALGNLGTRDKPIRQLRTGIAFIVHQWEQCQDFNPQNRHFLSSNSQEKFKVTLKHILRIQRLECLLALILNTCNTKRQSGLTRLALKFSIWFYSTGIVISRKITFMPAKPVSTMLQKLSKCEVKA